MQKLLLVLKSKDGNEEVEFRNSLSIFTTAKSSFQLYRCNKRQGDFFHI